MLARDTRRSSPMEMAVTPVTESQMSNSQMLFADSMQEQPKGEFQVTRFVGVTGGAYVIKNNVDGRRYILKPADEEAYTSTPKDEKQMDSSTSSSLEVIDPSESKIPKRRGIRYGLTSIKECAAYLLDHQRSAGVPPTTLVGAFPVSQNQMSGTLEKSGLFVPSSITSSQNSTSLIQPTLSTSQSMPSMEELQERPSQRTSAIKFKPMLRTVVSPRADSHSSNEGIVATLCGKIKRRREVLKSLLVAQGSGRNTPEEEAVKLRLACVHRLEIQKLVNTLKQTARGGSSPRIASANRTLSPSKSSLCFPKFQESLHDIEVLDLKSSSSNGTYDYSGKGLPSSRDTPKSEERKVEKKQDGKRDNLKSIPSSRSTTDTSASVASDISRSVVPDTNRSVSYTSKSTISELSRPTSDVLSGLSEQPSIISAASRSIGNTAASVSDIMGARSLSGSTQVSTDSKSLSQRALIPLKPEPMRKAKMVKLVGGSNEGKFSYSQMPAQGVRLASLQEYVENIGGADDFGSSAFDTENVHRIGILDVRLFNMDRHLGNLLVKKSNDHGKGLVLIPIDHAYTIPDFRHLSDANFEWLFWRQARKPFSKATLEYINSLDPYFDASVLRRLGIPEEEATTIVITTLFLQKCARAGFTLAEIGEMIQREGLGEKPSELEKIVSKALAIEESKRIHRNPRKDPKALRHFLYGHSKNKKRLLLQRLRHSPKVSPKASPEKLGQRSDVASTSTESLENFGLPRRRSEGNPDFSDRKVSRGQSERYLSGVSGKSSDQTLRRNNDDTRHRIHNGWDLRWSRSARHFLEAVNDLMDNVIQERVS
mmetsp:Transcript_7894/g.11882  ORF Transcript_7894/g.11882 Transcript_7894/m.11882 type:complete len:823 (+) Transcript_7894:244-2712(+)|eukprot:CAMPEP_0167760054 /NCGR_PEP_ID=MMETSP0110_2-20121227/11373_1 /TAXON_ID=629695 /ORGANISM="Gymnochlora sp., Strain CCMP2014" /LENGTH=822 /DNA_ID=CAMNT_0007646523 /DNA_START=145 /DNA_END=2613 /DNA_ORIENTATION=+